MIIALLAALGGLSAWYVASSARTAEQESKERAAKKAAQAKAAAARAKAEAEAKAAELARRSRQPTTSRSTKSTLPSIPKSSSTKLRGYRSMMDMNGEDYDNL